jgi:alkanesulfonate monooxygenase SsuD/methylene tetrahydromethanopterin reductase-like flavin-dependent oxidoreductase (luciferase family)
MLVGGSSGEALARMARYADGYMHGGGPPRAFAGAASKALTAWSDLGRPGRPRLWGMGYFALGDGSGDVGADYLRHYYAFTGPFAEKIAAGKERSQTLSVATKMPAAMSWCCSPRSRASSISIDWLR